MLKNILTITPQKIVTPKTKFYTAYEGAMVIFVHVLYSVLQAEIQSDKIDKGTKKKLVSNTTRLFRHYIHFKFPELIAELLFSREMC